MASASVVAEVARAGEVGEVSEIWGTITWTLTS